jgi:hypothetical protein
MSDLAYGGQAARQTPSDEAGQAVAIAIAEAEDSRAGAIGLLLKISGSMPARRPSGLTGRDHYGHFCA